MAEDREGLSPREQASLNPERAKTGVREAVRGVLNTIIDQNPVVREQAKSMDRVQSVLPEGRVKDAVGLAVDAVKVPQAIMARNLEMIKKVVPGFALVMIIPEQIGAIGQKAIGFVAEKVAESAPVKFAVGSVDGVLDGILGKREAAPRPKVTLENAHQVLVGMARAEIKK